MPPTVQSLSDIVSQIQAAQAPENQQIDQSIAQNETSGAGQTAALNAAKDTAFGNITQQANNRGMLFSGFTPDAQAKYTGSTYLPALAKLQATIAGTRNTLLGQKANLATTANTQGLSELNNEKGQLNAYNNAQTAAQATAAAAAARNAATIQAASIRASSATPKTPSSSEINAALLADINSHLKASKAISTPGYAESVALPQLYQAYQQYGLAPAAIAKTYYDTRSAERYR
jgi:hypothetical protein